MNFLIPAIPFSYMAVEVVAKRVVGGRGLYKQSASQEMYVKGKVRP